MATQFSIDQEDRARYEDSVNDPNITAEEREVRVAITKWARSQKPIGEAWNFVWTTWEGEGRDLKVGQEPKA